MCSDSREIIKSSQLFWKLSGGQIDKIVALCEEKSYGAGARIFSPGDTARYFYIVKEGKVALDLVIRIGSRTRKQMTIDVMTEGEVFGWPALFPETPIFSNAATAIENTKLLVFSGERVRQLYDEDKDLYRKVMEGLVHLVSDRFEHVRRTLAQVLSVTSHDLRAPLATVQSCLDVIVGGFVGDVNDRQRELLVGSKQRISDLTNMIDNILEISQVEIRELDFEPLSLYEVIENSMGDVQGIALKKEMKLKNNVSTELTQVLGMPKRLQQVVTNLLGNAAKFTPKSGTITIDSRETDDFVQIEVADTGIGISPEDLPRIFDDFYRGAKVEESEGAGLGLSIAKKIIDAHGGRIWAESPDPETGVGSRFFFTLPKVLAKGKGREEEEKRAIAGAKILVVDDDPAMLRATTLVLESGGYQVVTARDGEEALSKIEEQKPDLLILDLLMPKMDGFEVMKRLDEQVGVGGSRIPILILSAVREDSSRRRYELETKASLGVDDYVEKPITPPVLLQKVDRILTRRRAVL